MQKLETKASGLQQQLLPILLLLHLLACLPRIYAILAGTSREDWDWDWEDPMER